MKTFHALGAKKRKVTDQFFVDSKCPLREKTFWKMKQLKHFGTECQIISRDKSETGHPACSQTLHEKRV